MNLAVLFGILSAALYGATDFVARFANKEGGVLKTMLWGQGCVALLLTIVVVWRGHYPHAGGMPWAILAASDLAILAGTACLYRGLAAGRLTVVCPIMASYGAVSAALSVATGESLSMAAAAGVGLAGAGAILCGVTKGDDTGKPSGWLPAAGAALLYGLGFWLQGRFVLPVFGPLPTLWIYYLMATGIVALVCAARRQPVVPARWKQAGLMLLCGILAAGGYGALAAGQATGKLAIATALSAASTAVTVLLAFAFLKERPRWQGWLGIAAVATGVALVHLGR